MLALRYTCLVVILTILSTSTNKSLCAQDFDPALGALMSSKDKAKSHYVDQFQEFYDENDRTQKPWNFGFAFGYNLTQGNAETALVTSAFHAVYNKGEDSWFLGVMGAVGEQNEETTQEFGRADVEYNRSLSNKTYFGVGSTAITDRVADIDYRAFINCLIGIRLKESKEWSLSTEVGPSWVFQRQESNSENFLAPRFGETVKWQLSEATSLYNRGELFISTEDPDKILVNTEVGIETSLTRTLSLVISLQDRFDNRPAQGKERNDVLITTSLKVRG